MNNDNFDLVIVLASIVIVVAYNIVNFEAMSLSKSTKQLIRWFVLVTIVAGGCAMIFCFTSLLPK